MATQDHDSCVSSLPSFVLILTLFYDLCYASLCVLLKNWMRMDPVGNTGCGDFTRDSATVLRETGRREENVWLIKVGWPTLNLPFLEY